MVRKNHVAKFQFEYHFFTALVLLIKIHVKNISQKSIVKKLQAFKVFTFQVKNIYMIFDDIDGFFQQNDIKPYNKAISRQENTKNTLYYVTLY